MEQSVSVIKAQNDFKKKKEKRLPHLEWQAVAICIK